MISLKRTMRFLSNRQVYTIASYAQSGIVKKYNYEMLRTKNVEELNKEMENISMDMRLLSIRYASAKHDYDNKYHKMALYKIAIYDRITELKK